MQGNLKSVPFLEDYKNYDDNKLKDILKLTNKELKFINNEISDYYNEKKIKEKIKENFK